MLMTRKEADTENIRQWVLNDEDLYNSAREFMKRRKSARRAPYRNWIRWAGMGGSHTADGTRFDSHALDYRALNEMMWELWA